MLETRRAHLAVSHLQFGEPFVPLEGLGKRCCAEVADGIVLQSQLDQRAIFGRKRLGRQARRAAKGRESVTGLLGMWAHTKRVGPRGAMPLVSFGLAPLRS